jgi:hypothetical protein
VNFKRSLPSHIVINPFEIAAEFKYLCKTAANQNDVHEEIKSRLKSENACYHSFQILFMFSFKINMNMSHNFYLLFCVSVKFSFLLLNEGHNYELTSTFFSNIDKIQCFYLQAQK